MSLIQIDGRCVVGAASLLGDSAASFKPRIILGGGADDHSPSGLRSNTIIIGPGRLVIQHMALK